MAVYLVEGPRSEVRFDAGDYFEILTDEDVEEFPELSFEYDVYDSYGLRDFYVAIPKGVTRQEFIKEFSSKVNYQFSVNDLYKDDYSDSQEVVDRSDKVSLYKIPLKRFSLSDNGDYYYANYRKHPLTRVGDPVNRIFLSKSQVCVRKGYLFVTRDYLDKVLKREGADWDDVFSPDPEIGLISRSDWYKKFRGK